jgi:hypothetical protein
MDSTDLSAKPSESEHRKFVVHCSVCETERDCLRHLYVTMRLNHRCLSLSWRRFLKSSEIVRKNGCKFRVKKSFAVNIYK